MLAMYFFYIKVFVASYNFQALSQEDLTFKEGIVCLSTVLK